MQFIIKFFKRKKQKDIKIEVFSKNSIPNGLKLEGGEVEFNSMPVLPKTF